MSASERPEIDEHCSLSESYQHVAVYAHLYWYSQGSERESITWATWATPLAKQSPKDLKYKISTQVLHCTHSLQLSYCTNFRPLWQFRGQICQQHIFTHKKCDYLMPNRIFKLNIDLHTYSQCLFNRPSCSGLPRLSLKQTFMIFSRFLQAGSPINSHQIKCTPNNKMIIPRPVLTWNFYSNEFTQCRLSVIYF